MKTNKFLGLVGTASALFAVFSVACASPAVQRSGDGTPDEPAAKSDTSSSSSSTKPTTPSTSTATTTGTPASTKDAGTPPPPPPPPAANWCNKLSACAATSSANDYVLLGYEVTAGLGKQEVCEAAYFTCKLDLFQTSCDKLTDCCDEMTTNGNSGSANTCRSKANAGVSDACESQLSTYQAQGMCN